MDVRGNMRHPKVSVNGSFSDRRFLLNFVMSNYIGPDVFSDNPRCSASQRLAKGLPPYTSKNLGSSFLSISQLENLYYYVLRNANSRLLLKPNMFLMYLKGNMPLAGSESSEESPQFTSFFPLNIHEHKRYSASHEIVKGIVLIDDPVTSCIKKDDLERFRCLINLDDLKIDKVQCLSYQHVYHETQEEEHNCLTNDHETPMAYASDHETPMAYASDQTGNSPAKILETCKRKPEEIASEHVCNRNPKTPQKSVEIYKRRCGDNNSLQKPVISHRVSASTDQNEELKTQTQETDRPAVLPLLATPNIEQCVSEASITLRGTASKGTHGPQVGVVDIGVSKSAYFFQVALPGVRKHYCEFSCEVESDGKVILHGWTSGGKTIKKQSRVFQMNFRQLCQPGPFTLSFTLPGPVDPRLFSPNFRSDGIFEAVIIRHLE